VLMGRGGGQLLKAGGERLSEVQQAKLQESAPKTRSKEVSDSLVTTKRDSMRRQRVMHCGQLHDQSIDVVDVIDTRLCYRSRNLKTR
jgi:hypothetical protein